MPNNYKVSDLDFIAYHSKIFPRQSKSIMWLARRPELLTSNYCGFFRGWPFGLAGTGGGL
ncbi:hypothetical protein M404DRAFT_1007320, partial [Pisolithus tinctorius Marx 270]